jgi:lysozyme
MPPAMKSNSNNRWHKTLVVVLALLLLSFPAVWAQGIDVSKYQGKINWTKVAKSKKVKFVYIRATEGATIQDGYYKTNVKAARKAGLLVGSYHVYSSKTTAYQQFANFKSMVSKKNQDLIPVLDIEGHHSGRLYMGRVDKLLELMEKEYGVRPVIYTSEKLYKTHFASKKYSKYHIFIANYRGYPTTRFTLWQYTETGHCPGISGYVDFIRIHRKHSLSDIKMPKPKKKPATPPAEQPEAVSDTTKK